MESLTLEQVYYSGELIAALAVVISLIYVGMQIKQNTQTLRLNAQHDASSEFIQWQHVLAQNGELMEIVMRSETEPESLNELERRRAWAARKHSYPDEFQVFINQLIKEGATSWNH